jgi:hypothetical protein
MWMGRDNARAAFRADASQQRNQIRMSDIRYTEIMRAWHQ